MAPTSIGNRLAFGLADPSHRGEEGMTYRMYLIGKLCGNSSFINPNFTPQESASMICDEADAVIEVMNLENEEAESQVQEQSVLYKVLKKIPFFSSLLN